MALHISTPTVLSIVNELEKRQMVEVNGEFESTGGRKAKILTAVRNSRYAVGLDITANHVSITYTDLSGRALNHRRIRKPFVYSDDYFAELARLTEEFVKEWDVPPEKIEGMGISMPAIINSREQIITNSHALGVYNVSCRSWTEKMPYRCDLVNDANAAAVTEISGRRIPGNMVYFSLSNTVGGAALFRDDLGRIKFWSPWQGDTYSLYEGDNWRSCEFGHMVIHPGGERCYCGKEGCVDAYCSALNWQTGQREIWRDFSWKWKRAMRSFRRYGKNIFRIWQLLLIISGCVLTAGSFWEDMWEATFPLI